MTSDPDQIREQIEETRTNLSEDVDALADTVDPAQAAKRKAASARSAARGVKTWSWAPRVGVLPSARSAAGRRLPTVREGLSSRPGQGVSGPGPAAQADGG